ncbi:M23 family peptidase [Coprococcus sp. AM25-15LB]|jgi:murein DD-endopeptidase MepM/ murein hydrolase activator NlpD|uniref:M23 family metallopeptidase n=1 Tax=Faecalimonas umbilicata TaxID=1912855 RepID=UPI000315D46E|nr:M23 family metallopeptidase [Faecalimonas umbilicata]MBS6604391.1 M23 family metallopeptidase [Lachnospiraceae bacterium]RGC76402.1 M23 family peptidase [Coprococcus sp. AM25-15LB]RJU68215.1 M23 family peptidase [Coprococcus sp. AM27-12LB]RJV28561.1 M23 family peptidase [Coprococcus sp. AF18-48]RJW11222.1 M23 family peptidase [Coprococcus sp. AM25-4LB]
MVVKKNCRAADSMRQGVFGRERIRRILFVFLAAFFCQIGLHEVYEEGKSERLHANTVQTAAFRRQYVTEEMESYIQKAEDPGRDLGIYWLETKFGYETFPWQISGETFQEREKRWKRNPSYESYRNTCRAIWNTVKYFPIPESEKPGRKFVSFADSWMEERNYGGKRGHEGTDLMAGENVRGLYPIISITDGTVAKIGWLEKGGNRIGIWTEAGAYFYYAHLDSYANLKVGDQVKAGQLLGFMGDTGYGEAGTKGMFPVHLHLGIYIYPDGTEMSINPYAILKYAEQKKLRYRY